MSINLHQINSALQDIEQSIGGVRKLINDYEREVNGEGCVHANAISYVSMGGGGSQVFCPDCDTKVSTTGAVLPPQGG